MGTHISTQSSAISEAGVFGSDQYSDRGRVSKKRKIRNHRRVQGLSSLERFCVVAALALMVALLFQGCSSVPVANQGHCQETDWYSVGLEDAKGDSGQRRQIQVICKDSDQSLNEAIYNNGFDSGIAAKCTYSNGWVVGRSGLKKSLSCPLMVQDDYDRGLADGFRLFELRERETLLLSQLKDLKAKLESSSQSTGVMREIKNLQKKLESDHADLRGQIQVLEKKRL